MTFPPKTRPARRRRFTHFLLLTALTTFLLLETMPRLPTMISGKLPDATLGPYKDIGYAVITAPAAAPITWESPRIKATGKPMLYIENVTFAVYYPSRPDPVATAYPGSKVAWRLSRLLGLSRAPGAKRYVPWAPRPLVETCNGITRFLSVLGAPGRVAVWRWLLPLVLRRVKFPVHQNASLKPPPPGHRYPVIIVSHGLAGNRNTYSHLCSALASEGCIVLAVEHKDGSGPMTIRGSTTGDGREEKYFHYVHLDDLEWTEPGIQNTFLEAGSQPDQILNRRLLEMGQRQIVMRKREVYEAYRALQLLVGELYHPADEIVIDGLAPDQRGDWLTSWKGNVDADKLGLIGHSFGGATVFDILLSPLNHPLLPKLPTKHAICYDPWLEALPHPDSQSPPQVDLLVLNTKQFTAWDMHFGGIMELVRKMKGSMITLQTGHHQSFSDFGILIPPPMQKKGLRFLGVTHALTMAAMRHELPRNVYVHEQLAELDVALEKAHTRIKSTKTAHKAVEVHLLARLDIGEGMTGSRATTDPDATLTEDMVAPDDNERKLSFTEFLDSGLLRLQPISSNLQVTVESEGDSTDDALTHVAGQELKDETRSSMIKERWDMSAFRNSYQTRWIKYGAS